ncbi:hypothetical protein [Microcoleus asticus]|uniref:Uncharacterized protein n=1 Tax=Microcoleus asticus IPMA8 TaxID=2563858 RepID=A0ABX2D744_9CYAN|nr:hypothetical protein [Microcoleus asticus]NQE38376.1 hypothetical protein [Microcoleus asticus IPMA8]
MSKEIESLAAQFAKILTNIDSGTVDIYKLTETFNDHIDRIVKLEQRVALLESKVNSQQVDTVPGANQDLYIYR